MDHLVKWGLHPYWASDIEPQRDDIFQADALTLTNTLKWADCIITNPPWDRRILHPMIEHFRNLNTTWLLFDADWAYTKQAKPYLPYCSKIIPVGRVSWMENGTSGKDNCAWYVFEKELVEYTEFCGG